MKLGIIIAAYNEETAIADVLKSLPKKISGASTISIVVDDGSSDGTFKAAKPYADYTLKHIVNLGQGAAMSTGFALAKKLKTDIIVTIDADGQHDTKDIKKMIEPILAGKADIVNGSRMFNTAGMPPFKVFGNKLMNVMTFLVFHKWSTDSQSGARAFSLKALKKISLHSMGHEVCSEVIGEAQRNKLRIVDVPIQTIYTDYSKQKGQNWLNAINIFTRLLVIKITGKR